MATNQVWSAPLTDEGGCLPCDWVPTGAVPDKVHVALTGSEFTLYHCSQIFSCEVSCTTSSVSNTTAHRFALKLVGGSYDATKKYSNGFSGCTDTIGSITWVGNAEFLFDVWADYRAGLWTGMVTVEIYEYHSSDGLGGCPAEECCAFVSAATTASRVTVTGGAAAAENISGAVAFSPTTCPWGVGGALAATLTIYDDGTYTLT